MTIADNNFNLFINNKRYSFAYILNNYNIIDACASLGYVLPRFCFHNKLAIAGNCRMCLIEILDSIKPIIACAMTVKPNIKIYLDSSLVKKAREIIIEFMLINHPLDCPVCDQGGECDLQEQTLLFGNDRNRYYEVKKAVMNKNCNPFIKTIMTRCIHCTRCIRFLKDLNLNFDLGMLGRGSNMEIGMYIDTSINSEFASNIIDLCPVGALTSKAYSFKVRPWELDVFNSFDVYDILAYNISIFMKDLEIVRILPLNKESFNEQWITDRTRYFFDAFYIQRIKYPYKYSKYFKKFMITNWFLFYKFIYFLKKNLLKNTKLHILLNLNFLNLTDMFYLKTLSLKTIKYSINNLRKQNKINKDFRFYLFNKFDLLEKIKNTKTILFFNDCNLRLNKPLLYLDFIKLYNSNLYIYFFSINCYYLNDFKMENLNINQTFYYNFLKNKTLFNIVIKKNIKYYNYKLIIFNDNIGYDFSSSSYLKKDSSITNYYVADTLFLINQYDINLKESKLISTLDSNNNKYLLNIILEDNLFLNLSFYKKIIKKSLINILYVSHSLLKFNKNTYKTFDYILPCNIFIENNINALNINGLMKKNLKINNWLYDSKSIFYFFYFLVLILNKESSSNLYKNFKKYYENPIKISYFNYINKIFLLNKENLYLNWFSQNYINNSYIINNLTSHSLLLQKGLFSFKKYNKKNFKYVF